MWIINHIQVVDAMGATMKSGWHCIAMDEGWQEWVEKTRTGSIDLTSWKSFRDTTEISREFYEAGDYTVGIAEYNSLRKLADWVTE